MDVAYLDFDKCPVLSPIPSPLTDGSTDCERAVRWTALEGYHQCAKSSWKPVTGGTPLVL